MSVLKKVYEMDAPGKSFEEKLYIVLSQMNFDRNGYRTSELDEGMYVIEQSICGWWKQRYLIDRNHCRAYEFMDGDMNFVYFTNDDIDWDSIERLPEKAKVRARAMSAQFPTFVRGFRNGVAEVAWQLNPDGRYYMDDDEMNVLVKFRYIREDWKQLKEMRCEAEQILKNKNLK